jgi:hypothetical protein
MDMGADDYLIKADTTPRVALEKVEAYFDQKQDNEGIPYIKPGINKFKIKNPHGGEDIEIEINIK